MKRELIFIQESLHTFKPSERKVAEFILEKPADVVNISIQKLAESTLTLKRPLSDNPARSNVRGLKNLK
ncbi:hypothetical protein [Bacillus sp. RO1]|uniref:hypothetical protein n=1 Tax=Bacillus sp. RO1 TaxID=2722703 RepID=UPI001F0D8D63|nr:hypothetical protein [Bacillus sp. RO1]